jgi:thiosulfate/3-mercaptopyruvate sulfurtransferase
MSNLIFVHDLHARLGDPALRLVDTRFDLADTAAGERAYERGHLPDAVYAHLDRDLSSPVGTHGGRHPLPRSQTLAARLGEMGIGNEHTVVVYDAGNSMFASRLWWLLRYLGHGDVKVLDGGFAAWTEAGSPVTSEPARHEPARFVPRVDRGMAVDREHLLRNLGNPDVLLVDARAAERYRGEVEPIDPRAGHIPSAINLPFAGNLEGGRFKSVEALRQRFDVTGDAEEVIVYCGSGVSAAHDVLAMEEAGLKDVKLYHGSWSDWCSYEDSPVATGDEP